MAFKLANSDNYIHLSNVKLSNYPELMQLKAEEMVEEGAVESMDEALKVAKDIEIELELYYEKGYGLFAVESEAVICGTIYSPYSGELGDDADED